MNVKIHHNGNILAQCALAILSIITLFPHSAGAQWNINPAVRNAISVIDSQQQNPAICPDGKGGAIIAWDDNRYDSIYTYIVAQRIDKWGNIKWTLNGEIVFHDHQGLLHNPVIISDGAGGAIVACYDDSAGRHLYTERLDSNGNNVWEGTEIDSIGLNFLGHPLIEQFTSLSLVPDGAHGAWAVWRRLDDTFDSLFAFHISGNGSILVHSKLVETTPSIFNGVAATSDSSAGLIIGAAASPSTFGDAVIHLQHLDGNGNFLWLPNGITISGRSGPNTDTTSVLSLFMSLSINDGLIIGFKTSEEDYVMGMNSQGKINWVNNYFVVQSAMGHIDTGSYAFTLFNSDDRGGALASINSTLYRYSSSGSIIWNSALKNGTELLSDSAGGAFVSWYSGNNLYAQHYDSLGNLFWGTGGRAICTYPDTQFQMAICQGDANELIATWKEARNYKKTQYDIYSAKLGDADLAVLDTLYDFGRVNLGDSAVVTLNNVMYNNGVDTLALDSINLNGPNQNQFAIDNDTENITLLYGQARSGVFSFTPTSIGVKNSYVIFVSGTKFLSPVIHLRGNSVTPAMTLGKSINFGGVQVGQFKDTVAAKIIKNTGTGFLRIDSIFIDGGGGQFTIDSVAALPITLDTNQTTTVKLRYTPSAAFGASAFLTVRGNVAADSLVLQGTGLQGALRVAPDTIDVGQTGVNVPKDSTVTGVITNAGTFGVTITQMHMSGGDSTMFSIQNIVPPITIGPGKSQDIAVQFLPLSIGAKQTTLVAVSNLPDTFRIILKGNGLVSETRAPVLALAVNAVIFPDTVVGAHDDSILTACVRNAGDTTLTVTSLSITGANASEFSVDDSATAFSLDSGATQTITAHFLPATAGVKTALLKFNSNSASSPFVFLQGTAHAPDTGVTAAGVLNISPDTVDFGNVPLLSNATKTETNFLTNSGTAPLTVTNMAVAGVNASDFSLASPAPPTFTLAAGASQSAQIQFIPAGTGARNAILTIYTAAGDSAIVFLSGNGTTSDVVLNDTSLYFGKIPIGNQFDSTVNQILVNKGTDSVRIVNADFAGNDANAFTLPLQTIPVVLPPNATSGFTIQFTPHHTKLNTSTLRLMFDSGDTVSLTVSGTGTRLTNLFTGNAHGVPGASVNVPVTIDSSLAVTGVRQFQILVQYDQFEFYPTGIQTQSTGSAGWVIQPLAPSHGFVTITAAGAQALNPDSLLFVIQGEILANSVMSSPIVLSPLSWTGDTDVTLESVGEGTITTDSLCGFTGESFQPLVETTFYNPSPNPATDNVNLQYWVPNTAPASILLYDAAGKLVLSHNCGTLQQGENQATLDLSALRSGTYMCRLLYNGNIYTQRIAVQR